MINNYREIVNNLVKDLPKNDYPVLNTRLWVETWFHFIVNQSATAVTAVTPTVVTAAVAPICNQPLNDMKTELTG